MVYNNVMAKVKKKLFDYIAPRNVNGVIAKGSNLYIVREVQGDDGTIFYASPILFPDKCVRFCGEMVNVISRKDIRKSIESVLKKNGCFYT